MNTFCGSEVPLGYVAILYNQIQDAFHCEVGES